MKAIAGGALAMALTASIIFTGTRAAAAVTERTMNIEGLATTHVRPDGSARMPLAVIIAGSGATDRDGNSVQGLNTNTYKLLAHALAQLGIASVRYDKRGVAGSADLGRDEPQLTIDTYAKDAAAMATWAKALPGVASVVLVGHSEGGVLALMAARQAQARAVVLLATPGRPLGTILREQVSKPALPAELRNEALAIIAALERGEEVKTVGPALEPLFRTSVQPFLKSWLRVDPAQLLKGLDMAALAIGGGRDIQVGRSEFDALAGARANVKSQWYPAMGHTLKLVGEGLQAQQAAYADPAIPLADGLAERIATFIHEAAGTAKAKK